MMAGYEAFIDLFEPLILPGWNDDITEYQYSNWVHKVEFIVDVC